MWASHFPSCQSARLSIAVALDDAGTTTAAGFAGAARAPMARSAEARRLLLSMLEVVVWENNLLGLEFAGAGDELN